MFVLCPHCHFLVGIDPRTGAPPADCPKCGGVVVPPLPPAAEEATPANGNHALDPFAPVALPPLAPVAADEAALHEAPAAAEPAASEPEPDRPARKPRTRTRRAVTAAAEVPVPSEAAPALPEPGGGSGPDDAAPAAPGPPVAPEIEPASGDAPWVAAEATIAADIPDAPSSDDDDDAADATPSQDAPVAIAAIAPASDAVEDGAATPLPHDTVATAAAPLRAAPSRGRAQAPSFVDRRRAVAPRRRGWRAPAAAAALAVLLAAQLLLAQRETLAADARWRPVLAPLCAALGCVLPPWREPAAFTMLSRDVRPHPSEPGTLLINASFRNDARWPQPWPRLLLTLSDLDGRMVGSRAFEAGEYLGARPPQPELAPGQSAAVVLAVVEPAPNVVAFTFDFR